MIIKFEPHSFVVFLTMAMGFSYAIFNARTGLTFFKVLAFAFVVVPFLYVGIEKGHVIDIALGTVISFVYARGGIELPYFSLMDWVEKK